VKQRVRTTCPRDCYDGCGVLVELDGDRIHRVLGDPDHPVSRGKLCAKCAFAYNGVWRDPDARLQRPLRRAGAKGEGRFAPISWDEALSEIAERLGDIVSECGGRSVLHAHYTGTCSLLAGEFPMRFFHRLGATEVEPDTICNNAGHVALSYVYGTSVDGFDPKTIRDARCVVLWGVNPSASAPHVHEHWLDEAPGPVIAIDPVRHASAEKADIHVQLLPGSDAALAFGLMHAIRAAGRVDEAFLAAHAQGWEELEPLVADATPAWTAEATGVPVATIEEVARRYAEGPSLLWLGQGLQRQPRGGNVMRACAALPAITGNLGKPGAGLCYLNGDGPRNIDADIVGAPQLRREPASNIGHMELADALADPQRARAFFCWNMNVAASAPRQRALRRALAREDLFSVVVELFQTDTADFADIVLPAASFLEFDDLVVPYFHLLVSAQVKAVDPPGEALPNPEIFRRLARAMGFDEPELYTPDREILDALLANSGLDLDFDSLAREGSVDPFPEPVIAFADLAFPTPSGRIELASPGAEADGHPRVPQPHADPKPPRGTLRLLSPASRWLMNDSYANDPQVRRALGAPRVTVHPEDARALGLEDDGLARLSNEIGEILLRVAISDAVPPGVALAHKGHWPKLEDGGANVNALVPALRSDMGESTSVHGTLVQIAPAAPQ
jgi:anaerobic selenocysteine-containing dehydrogenase